MGRGTWDVGWHRMADLGVEGNDREAAWKPLVITEYGMFGWWLSRRIYQDDKISGGRKRYF